MTIIFLGGIPGVGKTTLAYRLASVYKIDKVISLDILKTTLKHFIDIDSEPYLYTTTHSAYKLENLSIIEGFKKHSEIINSYFYKIINDFSNEKVIIVEGATITKQFVDSFKSHNVYYFNLFIDSKLELVKRFNSKMKMRKGEWIKNIDNIIKINKYLKEQSTINIEAMNISKTIKTLKENIDESIFL